MSDIDGALNELKNASQMVTDALGCLNYIQRKLQKNSSKELITEIQMLGNTAIDLADAIDDLHINITQQLKANE